MRYVSSIIGTTGTTGITAELQNSYSYQPSATSHELCALSCSIPGGTTSLNRESRKINDLLDFFIYISKNEEPSNSEVRSSELSILLFLIRHS
jgi:hypothetical protein